MHHAKTSFGVQDEFVQKNVAAKYDHAEDNSAQTNTFQTTRRINHATLMGKETQIPKCAWRGNMSSPTG